MSGTIYGTILWCIKILHTSRSQEQVIWNILSNLKFCNVFWCTFVSKAFALLHFIYLFYFILLLWFYVSMILILPVWILKKIKISLLTRMSLFCCYCVAKEGNMSSKSYISKTCMFANEVQFWWFITLWNTNQHERGVYIQNTNSKWEFCGKHLTCGMVISSFVYRYTLPYTD